MVVFDLEALSGAAQRLERAEQLIGLSQVQCIESITEPAIDREQ